MKIPDTNSIKQKMDEKINIKLKNCAEKFFEKGGGHSFDHTLRVYNLAIKLANKKTDLQILTASCLLHDIARNKQEKGEVKCHAIKGGEMAEEILKKVNFPEKKIKDVQHAIITHRQSTKLEPKTIEAKILQDADRLDALGAIVIGRMFSTSGKMNIPFYDPNIPLEKKTKAGYSATTINGFQSKILKINPKKFHTKKGRKIAKKRYKFVKKFIERFLKEWEEGL